MRMLLPLLLATMFFSAVSAGEKPKIAVMDLQAKTGIDVMTASMLTDVLCTEIKDQGAYKVISREDIRAMLSHVQDQQLLGCDDTRCLAEIGGALGVPLLLFGNIGKLGSIYLVNLKLIDIDNTDVVNRITKEFSGDEGGLIQFIRRSVNVLFETPGAPVPEVTSPPRESQPATPGTRRRIVTPPVAEPAPQSVPVKSPVPPITKPMGSPAGNKGPSKTAVSRLILFGAGITTSTAAYLVYRNGQQLHDGDYAAATTTAEEAGYWKQLEDAARTTNILLGISGALFAGGAITFAF